MIKNVFLKKSLLQKGFALFLGGIIMNIFNYFYRIAMARMLGPELFGELIVIISLFSIWAVLADSLQATIAKFTAIFENQEKKKINELFNYFTKITTLIGVGIIIFLILFGKKIQIFLNISYKNSVYFLATMVVITFLSGITKGVLSGLQRFVNFSLVNILEGFLRLGLGLVLVILGFKLTGALTAFLLSLVLSYFLAIYFIYDRIKNSQNSSTVKEMKEKRETWQYTFCNFLALLLLSFLANIDKILVKRYFSAFDAGIFSAFSTLGQAIFIGIISFGGIIFPITASQQAKKENYFESLKTVSFVCFLIATVGIIISFFFPKELILIFFGKNYLDGAPFLGYYSIAMAVLGFIFIFSYFFMALNDFKFLLLLISGAILQVLMIFLNHSTFLQIILALDFAFLILLIGLIFLLSQKNLWRLNKKENFF